MREAPSFVEIENVGEIYNTRQLGEGFLEQKESVSGKYNREISILLRHTVDFDIYVSLQPHRRRDFYL
jgi:hypothetical protein